MIRVVPVLVLIGLLVYAFTDCVVAREDRAAGVPKIAWLVIIVVVPILGPLAWLFASRSPAMNADADADEGTAGGPRGEQPRSSRAAARRGPVAPDDDPDFLRHLTEQNRREPDKGSGDGTDGPA